MCYFWHLWNQWANINTALGLHALQHRGQEAAGIVSFDGRHFHAHRGLGHVGENFDAGSAEMQALHGHVAIGHNRYSTSGKTNALMEIQPFSSELAFGGFALAHNGNLTNAARLRASLVETGSLFQSSSDTEIIVHLVARSHQDTVKDRLIDAIKQIEGAFSLVCIAKDMLIGVRDPHGVRPLVLGKQGDAFVLASETCALDIVGASFVRDLKPGEMVIIDKNGIISHNPFIPQSHRFCIFEYIYFARPDSILEGAVSTTRVSRLAPSWPKRHLPMPIWWYRCQIQGCLLPWDSLKRQKSRSILALFATTILAEPLFSQRKKAALTASK